MTKAPYRLWRKLSLMGGYYQILGRKEVVRPPHTFLHLPKAQFNWRQRQTIINWRFGVPPNYDQPINSLAAVAQQLKVKPTTVKRVLEIFKEKGCKNPRRPTNKPGSGKLR